MLWAILVGVDFYVNDPCLKGSVADVLAVYRSLQSVTHHDDIKLLTATVPHDTTVKVPSELPEQRATKANVLLALKRVIKESRPGDFVYFHYSGHGSREPHEEKYAHARGNLALNLFDENPPGKGYLKGLDLGKFFRNMVTRGLRVTAILDCCYSGSVLRDDTPGTFVREIPYDPLVEVASSPVDDVLSNYELRGARLSLDQWLVDPAGYTILAACGPHEIAQEIKIKSTGGFRGALSYFLEEALASLAKTGNEFTHQSLYDHLRVTFRANWPQQTPMLYGRSNHSMFAQPSVTATRTNFSPNVSTLVFWEDGHLRLHAGEAHGVKSEDEYNLYPSQFMGGGGSERRDIAPTTVMVSVVEDLTSHLVGIGPNQDLSHIESGWKAVETRSLQRRKIPVRIMPRAASQLCRAEPRTVPIPHRFLSIHDQDEKADSQACIFSVDLNSNNDTYEVLYGGRGRVPTLPAVPSTAPKAADHIWSIVGHAATFKFLEGLENQAPDLEFEKTFKIRASAASEPDSFGDASSSILDVPHEGDLSFIVENHGEDPLYLALFIFTSTWEVSNLLSDAGSNNFNVLQPKTGITQEGHVSESKETISVVMSIPDFLLNQGQTECEDVIKVFVTSRETTFPDMMLPEILPHFQLRHGDSAADMDTKYDTILGAVLGLGTSSSHVLRDDTESKPKPKPERWATKSFMIRTTLDKEGKAPESPAIM